MKHIRKSECAWRSTLEVEAIIAELPSEEAEPRNQLVISGLVRNPVLEGSPEVCVVDPFDLLACPL